METEIKLEHVSKNFGKRRVMDDLCLETHTGEVFGFLGPNGAGKTTTIKMLVGLIDFDEGEISVCGADVRRDFEKAMANVGGIVENPEMYRYMTGLQNLRQYARMRKGVTEERIREVVELVGLTNRIHEKVSKYSLGMRQRLGVAQSLLHHPKVLILDDSTSAVDTATDAKIRSAFAQKIPGTTKLIIAQRISSVQDADRILVLEDGHINGFDTHENLLKTNDIYREIYETQSKGGGDFDQPAPVQ